MAGKSLVLVFFDNTCERAAHLEAGCRCRTSFRARGGRGEDKISLYSALAVKGLSHFLIQRTDLVGVGL